MKFTINRHIFLKNLSDVQKAVATKTTIPILTGIKMVLTNDTLLLSGSDADISIERIIPVQEASNECTVTRTGSVVIGARFFGEIIRKLPGDYVTFDLKENFQLEITAEQSRFNVLGIDAVNYPKLPTIDTQDVIDVSPVLFKRIIAQTVLAASVQETRPILTGVCVTIENGQLTAVATDSHRMSQRVIRLSSIDQNKKYKAVIPAKSLIELSKILEDTDQLSIAFTENQLLFQAKNLYFYTRLLEGMYPEVSRLITDEHNTQLTIHAPAFLHAVDWVGLLSREGRNDTVQLVLNDQFAQLSSTSPEVGYVEEQLPFLTVTGAPLTISFNPQYMKDALRAFGEQDITINFLAHDRPFSLRIKEHEDNRPNDFVQIITPVRTFK